MTAELEQAREHFVQGIQAFEAGRLAEARECFEASLALAPGRASVLANLGITLFRMRQWRDALPLLRQAAAVDPGHADAWAYLGLTQEALGQWQAARDALARALQSGPGHAGLWLAYARSHLHAGAVDQALQAFDRAVAVAPDMAEAWSARGGLLRDLNRLDEAAQCFEKALSLGADPDLNGYYLAAARGTGAPANPPRRYVETLFDEYAADFQEHLVGHLRYEAPERLVRPLIDAGRRYRAVLDLGCGSGLCGQLVRPIADAIDGVDVSAAMLEQARRPGVYRELIHADLLPFLASTTRTADLVLAADVFIYVGELSAVFRSVRRILEPSGCFAFTVELSPEGEDIRLLPSLRYAHSETYVRRLAAAHGFELRETFKAALRYDQSTPVQGLYVFLE